MKQLRRSHRHQRPGTPIGYTVSCHLSTNTVELGYNVIKATEYFVSYNKCCEEFNVMVIIIFIIIIIIICHELGLDRAVSTSSNTFFKLFSFVFDYFVYNSALFLAFYCSSFLSHVVANLSCIFLVSPQLVLLSTLPKFPHSFCDQIRGGTGCSENFYLD